MNARGVRWEEVTAIFGGTFDPPHLGHREAIRGLFTEPGVREVWVVPSASPPHKPAQATVDERIEMTRLGLVNGMSGPTRLELCEIERARAKPGQPTYSYDTIQTLRTRVGSNAGLAFVVGTDQLVQLPTWHRFPELLGLCHWIVLARKPQSWEAALPTLHEWKASGLVEQVNERLWRIKNSIHYIGLVETYAPALSSSEIRRNIAKTGSPPANSLDPAVEAHLKLHRIYGSSEA